MITNELYQSTKILDVFGYSFISYGNKWSIIDDRKKIVGYILPVESNLGKYRFVINSDTINIDYIANTINKLSFNDIGTIIFNNDYLSFNFVSEYGDINVFLDEKNKSFGYSYSYKENHIKDRYDKKESCVLKNDDSNYKYSSNFYRYLVESKNIKKFWDKDRRFVEVIPDKNCSKDVHVTIYGLNNRKCYDKIKKDYSIEEYAIENGDGITLFKKIRNQLNIILPCKKDLLQELYHDKIDELGLCFLFNEHYLKYEKRLLNLLGYHYIKSQDENKLTIIDDHGKAVGYTEWGNLSFKDLGFILLNGSDNKKYHTIIDSDTIMANFTRDVIDSKLYLINVKGVGDVVFRFGQYKLEFDDSFFEIFSDKYGYISFSHNTDNEYGVIPGPNALEFNYNYNMNDYDVCERVRYRNKDYGTNNYYKEYRYLLSCKNKNDNDKTYGYEISSFSNAKEPQKLNTSIRNLKTNDNYGYNTFAKTVEELAIEHGRGIELFNRLRILINQLLPFKNDILYELFKDKIDEYGFRAFFDDENGKINSL